MDKLTAIIITKNEEKKISCCLNSLKSVADEIVVVDDLSSDATVKLCRDLGAKVIINESNGDFDKQRNLGIANATCEWILQMDADEIMPQETGEKIKFLINCPEEYVAFKLKRKNYFLGYFLRYSGAYDYMTKIFKKGSAKYTGSSVHETLSVDGQIGAIDADIEHYPYDSINQVIERSNFYNQIEANLFVSNAEKITLKEIRYRLTWRALRLFWKIYFKKKGYKDGTYGLAWCVLNVMSTQIKWLKIWEKAGREGKLID